MHIRTQINALKRTADTVEGFNRSEIVRNLKREGFKQLGRGVFAIALYHPSYPDLVIKVGQRNSHRKWCSHLRDGFPAYVEFLRFTETKSKFALKVYHHRHVGASNGGTYITVAERCYSGRGCKAQTRVTASGSVVRGLPWGTEGADPAATRFLKRFKASGYTLGHTLDLHSGNVMLRRDGTPVITDPLC
ncbi:hypothetical protein [Sinorhizobium meliloti]|uniref:Uncharacterized protein n=1 Tax=Rhizobium meliloti TaxID=382 RepID=A0AAW9TNF6_RHIML|nr:hypothetical protein [Sinorhizobium meliloti]MQW33587.1 hypothetical protein [Sinorhizobium meliloti]MQW46081.1 hypothetical protein [Sinorhizobium meliloti]